MKDSLWFLAQYLRCFLLGLFLVPRLVSGVALAQTAESDLFHQLTARCDTDSIPTKTLYLNVDALAFFNTISLKNEGARYSHMNTAFWSMEYARTFGRDYVFGAKANGYITDAGCLQLKNGAIDPAALRHTFSFGEFLRAQPRFLLKRFK